ncbi:hypothetical protein T02_6971 [Trichinella nativa]|uniref:Uncharacterized protein n=1 Tax=Trichinella nativa TaxID=6335 RepID=A0A0V1KJ54_9BILA|nr:hypothetical protein T02_6971 [Trichinella nativa]
MGVVLHHHHYSLVQSCIQYDWECDGTSTVFTLRCKTVQNQIQNLVIYH